MAKFILYSQPDSSECTSVRNYLTSRAVVFEERDITTKDKPYQQEMLNLGYYYPPVLLKEYEEVDKTNALKRFTTAGFNTEAIKKMIDKLV